MPLEAQTTLTPTPSTTPPASTEASPNLADKAAPFKTASPAPSVSADEGAKGFDFDALNKAFDVDDSEPLPVVEKAADEKPAKEKSPQEPKPAESATPAPEVTLKEEAKPAEEVKPKVEETPPKDELKPKPTLSLEEQKAQYTKWRTDSEARLSELYKLSEEDGERMLTKPEEILPKLAARVHMDIYESIMHDVQTRLPQVVSVILAQDMQRRKYEDAFYAKFPALKGHEATVMKFATAFRQLDPNAKADDFMNAVGSAVMASLGLSAAAPAAPTPNKTATTISREIVQPGGGFTPAPAGAVAPTAPKPTLGVWEQMAQDVLEDD